MAADALASHDDSHAIANGYSQARNNVLRHLIKLAIFASLTAVLIGIAFTEQAKGASAWFIWALVSYPFAAAAMRNVHGLVARPHLILTPEALHLRYWPRVGLLRMFLPLYVLRNCTIPWREYAGCRTFRHRLNGITTWRSLILETTTQVHEIGWDHFRPSVDRLQEEILDYIEFTFHQPVREEMEVAQFCRARYQTPLQVAARRTGVAAPVALVLLTALACGLIAMLVPSFPNTGWMWIPGILAFLTVVCIYTAIEQHMQGSGKRVVLLGGEGIALGNTPDALQVISWEQIAFARPRTFSDVSGSGKWRQARTTALDIRLRDGGKVRLYPLYHRTLDDLRELIDPPASKVAAAYELLAQGNDLESAALAAGLPARGD